MEVYLDRMTALLERQVKLPGGLRVALPTAAVFCVAAAANLIGVLGGAILFFPDSANE